MSISTPTVTLSHSFPAFRVNVRDFGTVVGFAPDPGRIRAHRARISCRAQPDEYPAAIEHQRLRRPGMTLVIISGGIDLSVGPTAALSAVLAAADGCGRAAGIAVVAGLGLGAICGLVNGALVAFGGLQPFIVTLGTLSTYRALALIFTGGNPVLGVPAGIPISANGYFFGVPASVIAVIVVALLAAILLRKTPFGEYLLAVGGNEEAAHIAGVPIALTKIGAYVLSGVLAALAALILIGRLGGRRTDLRQSLGARRYRRGGHRRRVADGRQGQHHRHIAWRHHPWRDAQRPNAP